MNILLVRPAENPEQCRQLGLAIDKKLDGEIRSRAMVVYPSNKGYHEICRCLAGSLGIINTAVENCLRFEVNSSGAKKSAINQMLTSYGNPRKINTLIIMTPHNSVIDHIVRNRTGQIRRDDMVILPHKTFILINGLGAISSVGF